MSHIVILTCGWGFLRLLFRIAVCTCSCRLSAMSDVGTAADVVSCQLELQATLKKAQRPVHILLCFVTMQQQCLH